MDRGQERLRLRSEIAGLRVLAALARMELKYRADQARVAKGQPDGGRFAPEHGGGGRSRAFVPPIAAVAGRVAAGAAPEAGALAGAQGAAALAGATGGALAGAIGVSRAAGLAAVQSGAAGGMTPILGLPLPHLVPQSFKTPGAPPPEPPLKGQFEEECDEQFEEDMIDCKTKSAMYGRGSRAGRRFSLSVSIRPSSGGLSVCAKEWRARGRPSI